MEVGTEGRHADLISLHSEEEANLVAQRTGDSIQNFWMGLARSGDGSFIWVDESPFDFEFWLDGEPNSNGDDMENCVEAYYLDARWNDAGCSDYKAYICMTDKCKCIIII